MSDNTVLTTGVGGDTIRTDDLIDPATGLAFAKAQAVKLITGGDGIDGGFVSRANPLPVMDSEISKQLDRVLERLDRILKALEQDTL